jgi:hypothetical protein
MRARGLERLPIPLSDSGHRSTTLVFVFLDPALVVGLPGSYSGLVPYELDVGLRVALAVLRKVDR